MQKILWLSPNFNHYKARFLNHFAKRDGVVLHILAGEGNKSLGHREIEDEWSFILKKLPVKKRWFGFSIRVYFFLIKNYRAYDWIMVPREKKNIVLILLSFLLRYGLFRKYQTRLFSYNHPFFGNEYKEGFEAALLRFFYRWYDCTIFYTEKSKDKAVEKGLITEEKAAWANNTLDSEEIKEYYRFSYPDLEKPTILFIGRLVKSKKVEVLFDYYNVLKNKMAESGKNLILEIVGDGPLKEDVRNYSSKDKNIVYHGAVNEERSLSEIFKRSIFVFIPGHSGLSINHAFLYGRPYLTLEATDYTDAPEIDYLISGKNGYILSDTFEENMDLLLTLITNKEKLKNMCEEAYQTGKSLSIDNWCDQVSVSLNLTGN